MRSLHRGVAFGLVAVVTTMVGCGRSDSDRSTDTALTPAATSPQNASAPTADAPSASTATSPSTSPTTAATVGPAAPAASMGRVVDVQMLGDASGYRFAPVTVTVKRGDRIRWTMVSGAPHNVAFWPDSIPAGAAAKLGANMSKTMSPLTGRLLMTPNETYAVSFEGLPAGTYRYFCTPHLALGMKAVVQVE